MSCALSGSRWRHARRGGAPGPNYSTDILGTFFYRTFFGYNNLLGDADYGAAVATVIFFFILICTAGYFFVLQRRLRQRKEALEYAEKLTDLIG